MPSAPFDLSAGAVRGLQVALLSAGCYAGGVDGQWGPMTARAVAEFARQVARADGADASPAPPPAVAPSDLTRLLLHVAGSWVGLAESRQNTSWRDPQGLGRGERFPGFLRTVGWTPPEAYCAAFAKAVFAAAGADTQGMTLGSVESFDNLRRIGRTTREPSAGCAFFMQHGSSGQGHAGIVTGAARDGVFATIEGNTDALGSREGDGVYAKSRKVDFTRTAGLHLLGFALPIPAGATAKGGQA